MYVYLCECQHVCQGMSVCLYACMYALRPVLMSVCYKFTSPVESG